MGYGIPNEMVEKIKQLAKRDINNYKTRREEFYNNPMHWDNNKRRSAGLPVLRGNLNKYRSKVFKSSVISSELFEETERGINKIISNCAFSSSYFDKFVEVENAAGKSSKRILTIHKSILDEVYGL